MQLYDSEFGFPQSRLEKTLICLNLLQAPVRAKPIEKSI